MRLRGWYLILCVIGVVLPYWQGMEFSRSHGLNMAVFLEQAFASPGARYIVFDLLITAAVFIIFTIAEGRRLSMGRLWIPIAATFVVGVSLGLPLFLFMREKRLARE